MGSFGPFSSPSFTINIKKKSENSEGKSTIKDQRSYTQKVNKNYIASIRFGVGKSKNIIFNNYELKRFADSDSTRIKNTASPNGEPNYFISIVFYGWNLWNKHNWNGRDLNKTPTQLRDRIHPMVGFDLKNFGNSWLYGISIDITKGLDAVLAGQIAKVKILNGGFKEGDVFTGLKEEIPTKFDWQHEFYFGLSVDLRIATQVLNSLFPGSGG